jgi:hypothetical protein
LFPETECVQLAPDGVAGLPDAKSVEVRHGPNRAGIASVCAREVGLETKTEVRQEN